jgi:hypothetical protein
MKKVKLIAFFDSCEEVYLTVDYDDEPIAELPWPHDWPEKVSQKFVEERGFEVR